MQSSRARPALALFPRPIPFFLLANTTTTIPILCFLFVFLPAKIDPWNHDQDLVSVFYRGIVHARTHKRGGGGYFFLLAPGSSFVLSFYFCSFRLGVYGLGAKGLSLWHCYRRRKKGATTLGETSPCKMTERLLGW